MKIQKCNIDERNKIDLLIPKLHAAKLEEQAEREPVFDLREGENMLQFRLFLIS